MNKKIKNKIVLFSLGLLLFPVVSFASTIYISSNDKYIFSSEENFYVDILLDPEEKNVNAIEGAIVFPDDLVEVVDIYNGRTVITSWVEEPRVDGSSVVFSGIMAGGFSGLIDPTKSDIYMPGNIMRVVFSPKKEGTGQIYFDNTKLYLNNGSGTETFLLPKSFNFEISSKAGSSSDILIDTNPPEDFEPIIFRDPDIFDGKYFLVFETKDLETGVSFYEVKEGRNSWKQAKSPYLLEDQSLKSLIRVKAVDNASNIRIATVGTSYAKFLGFVVLVVSVLLVVIFFRRKTIRLIKILSRRK